MAYEDIYKGLTEEEKERMLKMDIPKFEVVGEFEMTEEEKEKSRKNLLHLMKKFGKEKQYFITYSLSILVSFDNGQIATKYRADSFIKTYYQK